MKYKALIFDFNGVLWWDSAIQEEAWQQTSETLRGTKLNEAELKEHLHGRNNKHTLEYLLGREIDNPEELEKLTQLKEENYRQKCLALGNNFTLSPGAVELLNYLKGKNIPITIATASEINNVKFFFEHLELTNWFSLENIIYDDGSRPGKPDPQIYLDAAKIVNYNASECVVIEDSRSGMQAANAAGIGFLIALGPQNKHADLIEVDGVKAVITQLNEVINLDLF